MTTLKEDIALLVERAREEHRRLMQKEQEREEVRKLARRVLNVGFSELVKQMGLRPGLPVDAKKIKELRRIKNHVMRNFG